MRRRRIVIIFAAIVLGVVVLQGSTSAARTSTHGIRATTGAPQTIEADDEAVETEATPTAPARRKDDDRSAQIAIGMVVAASAIGALLVLSQG